MLVRLISSWNHLSFLIFSCLIFCLFDHHFCFCLVQMNSLNFIFLTRYCKEMVMMKIHSAENASFRCLQFAASLYCQFCYLISWKFLYLHLKMKNRLQSIFPYFRALLQSVARIEGGFYLNYNSFKSLSYHKLLINEQDHLFLFYSVQDTHPKLWNDSWEKNHLINEKYLLSIFRLIFYQIFKI